MPKLFLIPTPLDGSMEPIADAQYARVRHFVVENAKTARAHLPFLIPGINISACVLVEVNEHTTADQIRDIVQEIQGHDIGILSEAGMPCVADPGAAIVLWAHGQGYQVISKPGPNAIVMALAGSGLNGQKFFFHGYLPRHLEQRVALIKQLEKESQHNDCTHIFIEAPHHNMSMFNDLLGATSPGTWICVACGLTSPQEMLITKTNAQWRQNEPPALHKIPTVFLMYAPPTGQRMRP